MRQIGKQMRQGSIWLLGLGVVAMIVGAPACAQVAQPVTATSQSVITSGLGSAAGVAVDPLGNVYAVDGTNNLAVTVAGGNGSAATLFSGLTSPGQIAVDTARNVYIANGTSNQVLELQYQSGSLNLNTPVKLGQGLGNVTGVAVDVKGNVYIVDAGNKQVVKIAGTTQTVLATGLTAPKQVAVDRAGNVYVADSGANSVVWITSGGVVSTVGSGLTAPAGVVTDPSNNVYIADTGNNRVVEVPYTSGAPVTGSQTVFVASIALPQSLAFDTRGTLYIASGTSIYRFASGGLFFGLLPVGTTSQVFPVTLNFTSAISPATISVVTTGLPNLDYQNAGGGTCAPGSYAAGSSCTINVTFKPLGAGPRYGAIVLYASTNKVLATIYLGGGGSGPVLTVDPGTAATVVPTGLTQTLNSPRGVTTDAAGNIFVADYNNGRVVEVQPASASATAPASVPATITGFSISGNVVTFTTKSNAFVAGQSVAISGLTYGTYLNGATLVVTTASTTQFTASFTFGSVTATTDSGTATPYVGTVALTGSVGTDSIAIDGAGNFINGNGSTSVVLYPYENGTWSVTDATTLAAGGSRDRVAHVDVAGNVFFCDAGSGATTPRVYEIPRGGTAVEWTGTSILGSYPAPACEGVAVDLMGNVAINDSTTNKILYVPATGAAPYETGSGLNASWGVAFDPSGSVWVTNSGAATLIRIPNENGTLAGGDQILSTAGAAKDYDLWVDSSGNVYTTQTPNSDTSFTIINRSRSPLNYTSTAVGATNATTQTLILSNSGNAAPIYTNGGTLSLFDIYDFPAKTASPACSYVNPLVPGFTCQLAYGFIPQSTGVRTEQIEFTSSNSTTTPFVLLAGQTTGTVSGTVTLALAMTTPSSGSPAPFQALTITGTMTPSGTTAPTGAVTFAIDGVPTSAVVLANNVVTLSISAGLPAGAHVITATYSGDKNYQPITTAVSLSFNVVLATSQVTLVPSGTDIAVGQALTLSGLVPTTTGLRTPTGTLTFTDTSTSTTLGTATLTSSTNGAGNLTTTSLALGSHNIAVTYSGDSVYASSTSSSVTVTVGNYAATTTALTVTPTQPVGGYPYGTGVTASATVTASSGTLNGGSVDFTLDGYPTSVTLNGATASLLLSNIPAGSHVIAACYSGNTTYASSCGTPYSFTIIRATTATTLTVSATGLYASQAETLTANVSSPSASPGGTVIFYNGASAIGSATLSGGTATLVTTALPVGSDSITAVYQGDSNDLTSTSSALTVAVQIVPTTLTLTATPGVVVSGGTSSLAATLTSTVPGVNFSGTVTFLSGTTTIGTGAVSASGAATTPTPALTAQTNCYTASYAGTPVFAASTSAAQACVYVTDSTGAGVVTTATLGSKLASAAGVATDLSGNIYISDSTSGTVDLIASGSGTQSAAVSSLPTPAGVATDGAGNLYIANGAANQVMKVPSVSGVLSTSTSVLYGSGLGTLTGVAVDPSGNIYAADSTNKQLVKIVPTPSSQTVLSTTLINPQQVAADANGNVYVADGTGNRVVYINAAGTQSTIGTGLLDPTGVAVDPYGNVFISDTGNNRVVEVPLLAGVPSTPGQSVVIASVTAPGQLALGRHQSILVTTGTSVLKWRALGANMGVLTPGVKSPAYAITFTFQSPTTPGEVEILSRGVSGGDYVDAGGSTCVAGTAYSVGQSCTVNVTFTPQGPGIRTGAVVLASSSGQPFVTAYLGGVGLAPQITVDPGTQVTYALGGGTIGGTAMSTTIRGITTDAAGNIYACDEGNGRVVVSNPAGTVASVLLTGTTCAALSQDGAGNILVTDTGNSRIVLLPNENGTVNGADAYVAATGFNAPHGSSYDGFGNIYVADSTNARVVFQPVGGATSTQTVVPLTTVKAPYDVAVDWQGNVAFVDNTLVTVQYLPANGTGEVQVGPVLCEIYGIAMDGGGAIYASELASSSATCGTTATPGKDLVRLVPGSGLIEEPFGHLGSNAESAYVDPQGNVWSGAGNTVYETIRSTAAPLAFATTAVGSKSVPLSVTLTNSGPAPAVFGNPSTLLFYDSADFSLSTAATFACNYTTSFAPGAGCTQSFLFNPVESGARTASFATSTNASVLPQTLLVLTGTGSGGTTLTATTTAVSLTAPKTTPAPYQSVTFTATLAATGGSGTPTGTITISLDGVAISLQTAASTVSYTLTQGMSQGFHTLTATYSGDANFAASTSSIIVSAAGSTPSTAVIVATPTAPTVGLTVSLTATITSTSGTGATPTGQVLFVDKTTGALIATATLNSSGVATATAATANNYSSANPNTLGLGAHSIVAEYSGDTTYQTALSPAASLTVVYPGNYTITITPTPFVVTVGQAAIGTITITPTADALGQFYQGSVGLACTAGLPAYSTCAFQPNTFVLDGTGAPVTGSFTILTQSQTASIADPAPASVIRLCLAPLGALTLMFFARRTRRGRKILKSRGFFGSAAVLMVATLLFSLTACGSHAPLRTATGTFQVTIQGTGTGNVNNSITLSVQVSN